MTEYFQDNDWWDFQKSLGAEVVESRGSGWHYFGRVDKDKVGRYLYLMYGPACETVPQLKAALADAKKKAQDLGCYRVVFEPPLPLTSDQVALSGAKKLEKSVQPERTLIVDLTQTEEEIIKGMNSTRRKQWRRVEKLGYEFDLCQSDEDYWYGVEMLRERAETKSFTVSDDHYFEQFYRMYKEGKASVFTAKQNGETKLVGYAVDSDTTRYYLYVGRDTSNESMTISGPFITYLMLQAKSKGLKKFDFFGISARDDVPDAYTGFTVFKRTFGGETVQFAGGWELPVNLPKFYLRQGIQAGKRLKKKVQPMLEEKVKPILERKKNSAENSGDK